MPVSLSVVRTACLIALVAPFTLHAESAVHVLTGTLGKSPIVVELNLTSAEDVTGRYFYEKYHKDLPLSGSSNGNDLTLTEGLSYDEQADLPKLALHKNPDATWAGQWSSKGKTFKVQLEEREIAGPGQAAEPGWQDIYKQSAYDYLRLTQLPLKADKKTTFMGHALQWWVEPASGVSMFEITSGYPTDQAARINQQLRARLWQEVVSYNECMLNASRSGGDFAQTVTPHLLTPGIVSLNVFTSYDCGGAHPDFGDSPINLDAGTAKALTLEDVLWVGKGAPLHYERDEKGDASFETYSDYRSKQFAPWLVAQLKATQPADMQAPATEDDCDYTDPSVWEFPSWYFTEEGIYFGPYFARVARACEGPEWSVVPYSVVKAHPGGTKLRLPD